MNKNNIHVLARAVIIKDEHILLAYDPRSQPMHYYELNVPFFYLPGGHIEFQESASQAVIREVKEEMGRTVKSTRFLGSMEHSWHFPGDEVCCHTHEINLIFDVDIPTIKPSTILKPREEHVAFKWIPLKELNDIDLRPELLKHLIPQWIFYNMACPIRDFLNHAEIIQ
jgi:ADP-ribose pyrophosphatase YjhB (NUDIX family)